jgi:hypothetical protein
MKRRWREVLTSWKEECMLDGRNYSTIPKQSFPGLLRALLEKDFGPSLRSGFESTGLYPFSVEKALSKLPSEEREVETAVQAQLLKRLSDMRYKAPPTTHARRPSQKEKLPAGEAYTCSLDSEEEDEPALVRPKRFRAAGESDSSSESSDESSSEEERSEVVKNIVERLKSRRPLFGEVQQDKIGDEESGDKGGDDQGVNDEGMGENEVLPDPAQDRPVEKTVQDNAQDWV